MSSSSEFNSSDYVHDSDFSSTPTEAQSPLFMIKHAMSASPSNIENIMDEDPSDATGNLADVSSSDEEVQHKEDPSDAPPPFSGNDGAASDISDEVSQLDLTDLEKYPATFSSSDEIVKRSDYVAAAMANCRNKMENSSLPESDSEEEIDNRPEREKLRIFLAHYNHDDKPKKTWNEFEADFIVNKSNVRNWFNDGCDTEEYKIKKGPGFVFYC
uniref:Homeobox domain-containing protein n=1 Tax=Panagrellus redivivus TaxID=6233 RepID=A0A7E4ZWW9_PANRE